MMARFAAVHESRNWFVASFPVRVTIGRFQIKADID
jgi:hypothetical protein